MNDYLNKNENNNEEDKILNFCRDNNFFIFGDFDDTIARIIIPNLFERIQEYEGLSEPPPIRFFINSPGGYIQYLKMLLSLIEIAKQNGIIIHTYVFGIAYSCASILASSGTKGYRFISPFAEHLPHLGQVSSGEIINDVEADRIHDFMKSHFDWVRMVYKKYAKIKNLNKIIHDDNYFIRGEDIIANGLADHIAFSF